MSTKLRVALIVIILLFGFFLAWYVNLQQENKIVVNMNDLNTITKNSIMLNSAIGHLKTAVNLALQSSFQTDVKQLNKLYKDFKMNIDDFTNLSKSLQNIYPSYKSLTNDSQQLEKLVVVINNLLKSKINAQDQLSTLYSTYQVKKEKVDKLYSSLMAEGKKTDLLMEKQLLNFVQQNASKYSTATDEEKDKIISTIQDYDYSKYSIRDQLYVLKQLITPMDNKDLLMSINEYYLLLYMLLYEPSDPNSTDLMSDASDYFFNGSANIQNPVYAAFINTVIPNLTMVWTNLQMKSASYYLAKTSLDSILPKIQSLNTEISNLTQKIQGEAKKYEPILASIKTHVASLRKTNDDFISKALSDVKLSMDQAKMWNLMIFIITILLGAILSFFAIMSIKKPIDSLIKVARKLGEGDLTVKIDAKTKATDMSILLNSFSAMANNLRDLIFKLHKSSDDINSISQTLSSSVEETTASIQEVSSNMDHTAKELELLSKKTDATTISLDNIQNTIQKTTDNNNLLTESIKEAVEKVDENKNIIMEAVSLMSETAEIVKTVAVVVGNLEKPTEEIKDFVKIVSTIANQTNLLALNAAIEAARAGESGKGFAVVADEIRQLAEESLAAADKIKNTVDSIVDGVDNATSTMEIGNMKVSGISEMTSNAKDSLASISESLQVVSDTINGMNSELLELNKSASNEIRNIKEVINSIDNISSIVADVNASMEEESAAMVNLANLADKLSNMIHEFKQMADKFKVE